MNTGDECEITGLTEMTELNGRRFIITEGVDANNFTLDDEDGTVHGTAESTGGANTCRACHTATGTSASPAGTTVPNHIVKPPTDNDCRVMAELKEGEKWNNAAIRVRERGEEAKNGRMISSRLLMDSTVNTVLDIDALTHPTQDRTLTLREGARLCGYPDSFEFAVNTKNDRGLGTNSDVTQAVLPYMGRYLSQRCMVSLENEDATPDGLPVIDFRKLAKPFSKKTYLKTKAADLALVAA